MESGTVHIPQRLSGESFADYKARRAASHRINKLAELGTPTKRIAATRAKEAHRDVVSAVGKRQAKRIRMAPLRALRDAKRAAAGAAS